MKSDTNKFPNLTKRQQVIYDLYFNQKMTQKDIAYSLQITQQSVSYSIKGIQKKLSKNGFIFHTCINKGMDAQKRISKNWRVEALNFMIKPYYFYPRYQKMRLEIGNYSIPHKRWRIFLHKDSIRVQLKEGCFFKGEGRLKAMLEAENDFNIFLNYAANKYGFEYEKDGKVSINCTNMELERENSKFAQDYVRQTGENYMQVKDDNGKVCFFVDISKTVEHGYKGKDAFSHSENLEPYIKDFLYNKPLNNSQLTMRMTDMVMVMEKLVNKIDEMR